MKTLDQIIYLASKSPRRRELLRQIGVQFELLILRDAAPRGPDVTEIVLPDEKPHDYVARVTLEKVEFAAKVLAMRHLPLRPILAADTTVVIDDCILGKPANAQEAAEMLTRLSGRTHQVLTGLALWHNTAQGAKICQQTHVSEVDFDTLSAEAIQAYCRGPEPYDKAGAYGIQGPAAIFIRTLRGSQSGIMGLPLFETAQLLRLAGLKLP
jgi:septum formation protein